MRTLSLLTLAVLLGACDSNGSEVSADIRLFDLEGEVTATGTLTFDEPIRLGVRTGGTYATGDDVTRGAGLLRAVCEDMGGGIGTLTITLDPSVPDGGTDLLGTCGSQLVGGEVFSNSLGGPERTGRFEFVEVVYEYH